MILMTKVKEDGSESIYSVLTHFFEKEGRAFVHVHVRLLEGRKYKDVSLKNIEVTGESLEEAFNYSITEAKEIVENNERL